MVYGGSKMERSISENGHTPRNAEYASSERDEAFAKGTATVSHACHKRRVRKDPQPRDGEVNTYVKLHYYRTIDSWFLNSPLQFTLHYSPFTVFNFPSYWTSDQRLIWYFCNVMENLELFSL